MRVPRELQINVKACDVVGEVWFVRQKNRGFAGRDRAQRFLQISGPSEHIVHTGEPETGRRRVRSALTRLASTRIPSACRARVMNRGSVLQSWFPITAHAPWAARIPPSRRAQGSAASAAFTLFPITGAETKSPTSKITSGRSWLTTAIAALKG